MKCKINLCFILEFMFFLDSSSVVVQIVCNYFCCNEISDSIYYIFDFNFVFTIILASVLNHSLYTRYPIVARALAYKITLHSNIKMFLKDPTSGSKMHLHS